jgi:uncharacterized protein (TIGR00299 family) protein
MIGYLDLQAGISGDMFLGCLVDAGWPVDRLRQTLERLRLPASSWSVEARDVMKGSLRATLVDVKVAEPPPAQHSFVLMPSAHGDHVHRNLDDIQKIIGAADLPQVVKDRAVAVFTRLGSAEAKVHGTTIDKIHFHEVGALDAIVDIVGAVAGVHDLGIEKLYASPLPASPGWVNIAHGQVQLPAPATLEILAAAGAPTRPGPGPGEHVTPTGAALVAELATFGQPAIRLKKIGLGAGQRNTPWPNIARLWIGEADGSDEASAPALVQLETNIDDMNPQLYPNVMEQLFAAGAADVWIAPVQMKKGRPGTVLSVLAKKALEREMADILLRQTTTLGVRIHDVRRHEARREIRPVQTAHGTVPVKLKWCGDDLVGATPEYEDCKRLSAATGVPLQQVYEAAVATVHETFRTTPRVGT